MRVAPGRNSRRSPSRFAPSSPVMKLTPVTLPPGRLRLATRPSWTGSPRTQRRPAPSWLRPWPRTPRGLLKLTIRGYLPAKQVGHQKRQPVGLTLVPAVFDRDVLVLDKACFLQALAERSHAVRSQ